MDDKDVKNYVVNYTDGTQEVVEKGFFCEMQDNEDGSCEMNLKMTGIEGKDLEKIVLGVIELGRRIGMFDDAPKSEK